MAALKIDRNILSVECDAMQFIHSKLRAVSILPDLPLNEDRNDKDENEDKNKDEDKGLDEDS